MPISRKADRQDLRVGWDYFDADTGGLGLFGFMEGQEMTRREGSAARSHHDGERYPGQDAGR